MKPTLLNPPLLALLAGPLAAFGDTTRPIAPVDLVFAEREGIVAVEAEHFSKQTQTGARAWHLVSPGHLPDVEPDGDPPHLYDASGGAYLECLPDTRRTHDDPLIKGENFTEDAGAMAVLRYKVHFANPGRYYVWVRAYCTGSEDNGLHVGLNGEWPESGRRWQTVQKDAWSWDNRQRTSDQHSGVPWQIYLDIPAPGEHEILFSMREDGFEFDKFVLASSRDFTPEGQGPHAVAHSGELPQVFAAVPASPKFPPHWGEPPLVQTRDLIELPGGYGMGSGTLAKWIQDKLDQDAAARQPDGDGGIAVDGELKQWHKVTLTLDGPFAREIDTDPNPFADFAFEVTFTHESGAPSYRVPGHFAADGNAAETSADSGTVWRVHLSPDKPGKWTYTTSFTKGKHAALDGGGEPIATCHGKTGTFEIAPTDKTGRDFRSEGRLQYVGRHHLQFAGSGRFFLKAGPDAPETLLAYADFDGTEARKKNVPLKTWAPHLHDWREGDPTWQGGKGKGLVGALNYLSGKGVNAFSFLPYNAGGDGDNVWPFVARDAKLHYDCSKLDQWGIVFDHATALGLYCHFKLQETENDDERHGPKRNERPTPAALDGGKLGPERKLYLRELISRSGHLLALNWNLGEENTQTTEEQRAMSDYIAKTDPYQHLRVIHTYPKDQDKVYPPLLGKQSGLTGVSLQNGWNQAHQRTLQWIQASAAAGKPWVVANDEQGGADTGVPPDLGYQGYDGKAEGKTIQTPDDIRKQTLWGNLMAGGAGVEYYFGYKLPENDLLCEDWRSRDQSWDWCRIALDFFRENEIPFHEMSNANALVGNEKNDNSKYCLAKPGSIYLVYFPKGGKITIDLDKKEGAFTLHWFNPREGGPLQADGDAIPGGAKSTLTAPGNEDWLAILRKL